MERVRQGQFSGKEQMFWLRSKRRRSILRMAGRRRWNGTCGPERSALLPYSRWHTL